MLCWPLPDAIRADRDKILAANDEDMRAGEARGLSPALLDRLRLDGERDRSDGAGRGRGRGAP